MPVIAFEDDIAAEFAAGRIHDYKLTVADAAYQYQLTRPHVGVGKWVTF